MTFVILIGVTILLSAGYAAAREILGASEPQAGRICRHPNDSFAWRSCQRFQSG
jgi:hypothetical protein